MSGFLSASEPFMHLTDLESGTVKFPSLFTQVRGVLMTENEIYSFKKGDLVYMNQISETLLCLKFSSLKQAREVQRELERQFVSPPNSNYPSALRIDFKDRCE